MIDQNQLRRLVAIAFCALSARAEAQPRRVAAPIVASRDSIVVSYLTMGAGEELFDRFGHAAIRIQNRRTGLDSAWNWGMYDFDSPGFLWRFLTGETRYWMSGFGTREFVDYYRRNGRAVWEQELALTPAESDSLLTLLRWTALPENKFYRYDYYRDNCSTRVRDALDAVLGGKLHRAFAGGLRERAGGTHDLTYRSETRRLAADFPVTALGMSFTLGPRADVPLKPWDEAFIPMRLRDDLRDAWIPREDGAHPIVAAEHVLVPEGKYVEAPSAPGGTGFGAIILLFAITVAFRVVRAPKQPSVRITAAAFATLWSAVAGFAGTLVLLAGLFTRHYFMGANTNVLLGTPASLALAVLIPLSLRQGASARLASATTALSNVAFVAALCALAVWFVPGIGPRDANPALLALPMHAAVLLAVHMLRLTAGK